MAQVPDSKLAAVTAGVVAVMWSAIGIVGGYFGSIYFNVAASLERAAAANPHQMQNTGPSLLAVFEAMFWPLGTMLLDGSLQPRDSSVNLFSLFVFNSLFWGVLAAGVVVLARHLILRITQR